MSQIQKKRRFVILDALRGIAALMVCFHHLFKFNVAYFELNLSSLLFHLCSLIASLNQEAVVFFFILSGFSIGLSLKNKNLREPAILNEYIYRRLKRILPIYWIAIVVSLVFGILMHQVYLSDYNAKNLIGNLLFLQSPGNVDDVWFTPYGKNGPLWSLAFEFFFYLIFPIAYYINTQYMKKHSVYVKFGLLGILSVGAMILFKIISIPYLLFFTSFIIWVQGYIVSTTFIHQKNYTVLFSILGTLSIILLVSQGYFISSNTLRIQAVGFLISSVFYFTMIFYNKSTLFKTIIDPVKIVIEKLFNHIGKGSYALYALHYPIVLFFVYSQTPMPIQLLSLCFLVYISYKLEEWSIQFKLLFLKRAYLKSIDSNYS